MCERGEESNHEHVDPNNTDNLGNTAEAITPHPRPIPSSSDSHVAPRGLGIKHFDDISKNTQKFHQPIKQR